MAALSFLSTIIMGGLLAICSPIIPQFYNIEPDIRQLASSYILVVAFVMPIHSFAHVSYFTLRSGGKTLVTFLFDSCFTWAVSVPAAYILSRYTNIYVVNVFMIVCLLDLIKCTIGFILVKSGVWVRNIVKAA